MVSGSDFGSDQSETNPALRDHLISTAERSGDAVIHPLTFIRRVRSLKAQGTQGDGLGEKTT